MRRTKNCQKHGRNGNEENSIAQRILLSNQGYSKQKQIIVWMEFSVSIPVV
jgi:hypothetical protein